MFSTNEDGNNKMFSLQDYMMKQKRQKSVFSLSKTVKRLFFLDFSTKSFYYKHQASDTDCKTISSFKDIRDVQEFDHPHQDIIRKWPYALKIITNSQVVILFDSIEKVTKWKEALDNIILMNKRLNDYKQLRRSRSQDKFSSQTSQQSNQQNQYQHTMQSQNANHYSQSNVANNFDFSSSRRTQSHSKTYNQQTPSTNMSNQKQSNTLHQQKQSSFQINPYGGNNDQNSKYIPVKNISISNFQQQQYQNQLLLKPQHASRSRQSDIGTKYTKTFIQNSEPFEYQDLNPGLHHQLTFSAEKQLKQYPTHRPLNSVRIDDHHNQHFITNQIDHQINHQQNMMVMNAQTVQEPQILRQSQSSLLQKSFGKYVVDQEQEPIKLRQSEIELLQKIQQNSMRSSSSSQSIKDMQKYVSKQSQQQVQEKQVKRYQFNLDFHNSKDSQESKNSKNTQQQQQSINKKIVNSQPHNDRLMDDDIYQGQSSINTIQEMPASFENSKISGVMAYDPSMKNSQAYQQDNFMDRSDFSFKMEASDIHYSLSKHKVQTIKPKKKPQFESEVDVIKTRTRRRDITRTDILLGNDPSCFGCKIIY